jgi:hypothetical protein
MDFTLKTYKQLLLTLKKQGFLFQTFQEFLEKPESKAIVLRHDVDKLPENSLGFAQIQHELGIKGSYYFRIVPENLPDFFWQAKSAGKPSIQQASLTEIFINSYNFGIQFQNCIFTHD